MTTGGLASAQTTDLIVNPGAEDNSVSDLVGGTLAARPILEVIMAQDFASISAPKALFVTSEIR